MNKLTISLAQMDIALGDPATNLSRVKTIAQQAADRGSDILVLPELWSTAYDLENAPSHATPTDSGIFADVAALAEAHNLHIVGSVLSTQPDGCGNTATWHAPSGELLGDYSKLHLFRLMDEEKFLVAGQSPTLIETAWGKVGLAICYDLRFPELFRHYALAGATAVIIPSEWPYPRLAHWRTLLRARAIENQMYIIACNRVGWKGETQFFGHSCIIDPWGNTVVEGGDTEMVLTADISTSTVEEIRKKIPIFEDRRPDLY